MSKMGTSPGSKRTEATESSLLNFLKSCRLDLSVVCNYGVWQAAFDSGVSWAKENLLTCPRCKGLGRVEADDFGWVSCPRCRYKNIVHYDVGEGKAKCCYSVEYDEKVTAEACSVTCVPCLQEMICN
jgi:hypothetical protein